VKVPSIPNHLARNIASGEEGSSKIYHDPVWQRLSPIAIGEVIN
jgi:hypothetical protein